MARSTPTDDAARDVVARRPLTGAPCRGPDPAPEPAPDPAGAPERAFILSRPLAGRLARHCAAHGERPADVIADAIVLFLDGEEVLAPEQFIACAVGTQERARGLAGRACPVDPGPSFAGEPSP